jgi:hypothetical protein
MIMLAVIVGRFARAMKAALVDPVFRVLLIALAIDLIGGMLAFMWLEGWGWVDALYFCVVTQATVGFGDIVPTTDAGKLFTVVYIFAGLGIIVTFAQRLSRHLYRHVYDVEAKADEQRAGAQAGSAPGPDDDQGGLPI